MKKIDVSTKAYPNTFALVDDENYEALSRHKWQAQKYKAGLRAWRIQKVDGIARAFLMHRVVLGLKHRDGKIVDHRDRNGLNNQKENLRQCTNSENMRNQGPQKNNKSGYKGVHWKTDKSRWAVVIVINNRSVWLGTYFCLIKAAEAYDRAAKIFHGDFAYLNFQDS